MKKYEFKTTTTMKPYNNDRYWIDSNLISTIIIEAENVENALKQYQKIVKNKHYVIVSDTALKNKEPMFTDYKNGETRQTGYVITGKTEFETDSKEWKTQYIELWVSILTIVDTEF